MCIGSHLLTAVIHVAADGFTHGVLKPRGSQITLQQRRYRKTSRNTEHPLDV